ncbi:MAG: hypothetical protein K9I29_07135 [Bacteroidales bacterium]|nr:hypothetical protein [Bacteroidales bacterium]MCF8328055.1 hypothetical protein [Bacteroidales bacterium]
MLKKILIPALLVFIMLTAMTIRPTDNPSWTKFKEFNGVEFYQKKVVKETADYKHSYILFKYVNTTDKNITLKWKLNLWIGDHCRSCNLPKGSEYDMKLSLAPAESIVGTLNDHDKKLKLMNKDLTKDAAKGISKFELEGLEKD